MSLRLNDFQPLVSNLWSPVLILGITSSLVFGAQENGGRCHGTAQTPAEINLPNISTLDSIAG
jgi:hypothetical protein